MQFNTKITIVAVVATFVFAASVLSSCNALDPKPSALSNDEIVVQADQLLNALYEGDRETFSANFDTTMAEVFSDSEFVEFREMIIETSGEYQSCNEPKLLNQQNFAIYRLPCQFEKEEVTLTLVYPVDGNEISGLYVDSNNIRSFSEQ